MAIMRLVNNDMNVERVSSHERSNNVGNSWKSSANNWKSSSYNRNIRHEIRRSNVGWACFNVVLIAYKAISIGKLMDYMQVELSVLVVIIV